MEVLLLPVGMQVRSMPLSAGAAFFHFGWLPGSGTPLRFGLESADRKVISGRIGSDGLHLCGLAHASVVCFGTRYLYRPPAGSIRGKTATAKSHIRVIARYTRIGPLASSETKVPEDAPRLAGETALCKRRLPLRIKVLTVKVPADNPFDIGIERTLEALRQSGVLTKSGKLGKPFR